MEPQLKYARVERERRFLLERFPAVQVVRVRRISDRYIEGTTLRLRQINEEGGPTILKLTQKIPGAGGAQEGFITTMHLTEDEFCVLEKLPAQQLSKMRHSAPPFGIDVFEGTLEGLLLAEAEFDSAAEADALSLPSFLGPEVSGDIRFTGGRLARASRQDVQAWLLEYKIKLGSS